MKNEEWFKKYLDLILKNTHFFRFTNNEFLDYLYNLIITQTGGKLYKYKTYCDYTYEAIENDYIFLNHPCFFDDLIDFTIEIDENKIKEEVLYSLSGYEPYKEYSFNNNPCLKEFSKKRFDHHVEKYINLFINDIKKLVDDFRKSKFMHCFAVSHNNQDLWEKYSNNYDGICIEYDLNLYKIKDPKLMNNYTSILPMLYSSSRPKFNYSKFLVKTFSSSKSVYSYVNDFEYDYELFQQLFYKNKEKWEIQNEWRMLFPDDVQQKYPFPLASAIYLGYKSEKKNIIMYKKLAESKKLNIYKQKYDPINKLLSYEEISK